MLAAPLFATCLLLGSPDRDPVVAPRPADRPAPPLLTDAPTQTVYPFNGHDLTGWEPASVGGRRGQAPSRPNLWVVGVSAPKPDEPGRLVIGTVDQGDAPELVCPGGGADLATVREFGPMRVTLEFLLPAQSNAGVIVHGRYELQLTHRRGQEGASGLASVYSFAAADPAPEIEPGTWHELSFVFTPARFAADGAKRHNAVFETVAVDGTEVHRRVPVPGSTGKRDRGAETPVGPLVLQGDHGPISFRNLRIEVPAADAPADPGPPGSVTVEIPAEVPAAPLDPPAAADVETAAEIDPEPDAGS